MKSEFVSGLGSAYFLNIPEWTPLSSVEEANFIRGYSPEWRQPTQRPAHHALEANQRSFVYYPPAHARQRARTSRTDFRIQSQPRTTVDILPGSYPTGPTFEMGFCKNNGRNLNAQNLFSEFRNAELPQSDPIPLDSSQSREGRDHSIPLAIKKTVGKKKKKKACPKAISLKSKGRRFELFCGHCQNIFYSKTTFRPKYNHHLVNHRCLTTNVRMQYVVGVRHRRCTARCSPHIGCIRFTSK